MARIRLILNIQVLLLLLVALGGVICNASKTKEKETKRPAKAVEFKKIEKKSTNEKRESAELADLYSFGQKEEPFRPIYQFHYPGALLKEPPTNYVTAPTNPQLSFNKLKPGPIINAGISQNPSTSNGDSNTSARSIQYAVTNSYNTEGGIQYGPNSYKPNSESGPQYASSVNHGPFVAASHQTSIGQARSHPVALYSATPVQHSSASMALPLHYGGIEQPLSPQPNQQNQYAIVFPREYMRHYQENLAAPFPLHTAQKVQLVYTQYSGSPAALKDQVYKQDAVQYVALSPHLAPPQGANTLVPGPGVITHIIPYYGPRAPHHQPILQQQPAAFYYGAFNQQVPSNSLAYTTNLPHQQQSIHKQQIYGPIQITAVGTAAASVPLKPVQQQQQLQHQTFTQFYQHYHPGAADYTRYSQSISGSNGSGGSSNPGEVPAYEAGSSSALKQGPLYSSPSSTNNPGSTYSGPAGSSGGKMTFTYGADPNYEGPMYAHPGAMHYGTHLYHPSRNVVHIGSNPVTAGSAAIAGVSPPSYHPQQQSPANNSHGSRGSSTSVLKFA